MPDIAYTPPYPGGWHNLPANTTPIDAAALQALDDGVAAATAQANAALAAATAAGGSFPVTGGTSLATAATGTWAAQINTAMNALAAAGGGDLRLPGGYIGLETGLIVPPGVALVMEGTPSQELLTDVAIGTVLVPVSGYTGDLVTLTSTSASNHNQGSSIRGGTIDAGTTATRALSVTGTDCWVILASLNGGTTATVSISAARCNWVHSWASNIAGASSATIVDLTGVDSVWTGGRLKAGRKYFAGGGAVLTGMHITGGDNNLFLSAQTTINGGYIDSATAAGGALITHDDPGPFNSVLNGVRYHQASGTAIDMIYEASTSCSVTVNGGTITSQNSAASRFRSIIRYSPAAAGDGTPDLTKIDPPTVGTFTGILILNPLGQLCPYQTVAQEITNGGTTVNNVHLTTASSWPATIVPNMVIEHPNVPSGTTVVSIDSTTQITMSAQATATGSGLTVDFIAPAVPAITGPLIGGGLVLNPGSQPTTATVPGGNSDGLIPVTNAAAPGGWVWAPTGQAYPTTGPPSDSVLGDNYVPQPGDTPIAFDPSTGAFYVRGLSPVTSSPVWSQVNGNPTVINGGT